MSPNRMQYNSCSLAFAIVSLSRGISPRQYPTVDNKVWQERKAAMLALVRSAKWQVSKHAKVRFRVRFRVNLSEPQSQTYLPKRKTNLIRTDIGRKTIYAEKINEKLRLELQIKVADRIFT